MAYRDNQKHLMAELNRAAREKQHFETRIVETARHLQSTTTDRDRLRDECVSLRACQHLMNLLPRSKAKLSSQHSSCLPQVDRVLLQ